MQLFDRDSRVEMSLPADKDMMLLVRLTASGMLARFPITVDMLDDFKMAVEEACGLLISKAGENARLRFSYDAAENVVEFVCGYEGNCAGEAVDENEIEFAEAILNSLASEIKIELTPEKTISSVRIKMNIEGAAK